VVSLEWPWRRLRWPLAAIGGLVAPLSHPTPMRVLGRPGASGCVERYNRSGQVLARPIVGHLQSHRLNQREADALEIGERAEIRLAHQRAFERAIESARRMRRQKRSETMRAIWARRRRRPVVTMLMLQNSLTRPTPARAGGDRCGSRGRT